MRKFLSISLMMLFIASCTTLRDLANIQKPALEYSNMSIQSMNFSEAVLLFEFDVNNPNPIGITASAYNYDFLVNKNSFLSGNQDRDVKIGASGNSVLQVPVTLQFSELLNTFSSLLQSNEFDYDLNTEFVFDIPGLGQQRLPVNASGSLPVPKIPRFEFAGYNVNRVSASGADMELKINVLNPNRFPISLQGAQYMLNVNGKEWLNTTIEETERVTSNESTEIVIPVQLNAAQMGSVLFDIMRGTSEFEYKLSGYVNVGAEIEGRSLIENINFARDGLFRR
jgi:LEA14-like dessication related protein